MKTIGKKNKKKIGCCRLFDYTVNPEIVLFTEKKKKKPEQNKTLFLVVIWLSLSTHL
jgi:hypothetical protein